MFQWDISAPWALAGFDANPATRAGKTGQSTLARANSRKF
jgi:hypothetical protein